MEEKEKRNQEIAFTRAIRAGKRIYYVDVKNSRDGDMFIALTESKKVLSGDEDAPQVSFEKHKIFIYKEDFAKLLDGLHEAVDYIEANQGKAQPREEKGSDEIKIELDF